MTRPLLALAVLASLAVAAPVPKALKKAGLYPTAVGTKWEYIYDGDEKQVMTDEVTQGKHRPDEFEVTRTIASGSKYLSVYRLADGELAIRVKENRSVDPPVLMAKVGMKAGDKWESEYKMFMGEASGVTIRGTEEVSVGKAEEITTPAGTFTATPVTRKSGGATLETYWYADGVGLVRVTRDGMKHPYLELKAFTPGKGKK
jgi:hypothetical protein